MRFRQLLIAVVPITVVVGALLLFQGHQSGTEETHAGGSMVIADKCSTPPVGSEAGQAPVTRDEAGRRTPSGNAKPAPKTGLEEAPIPGLLFHGDSINDFARIQAAPGAIQEVPDPLGSGEEVLRMTVSEQDVYPVTPTHSPRAQALSPDVIEEGDEFWLHTSFMLSPNFPTTDVDWIQLMQVHGPPFDGSSPWALKVDHGEILWQRNATHGWDIPWCMSLVRSRWIDVLVHQRFARDGWVEMWIDGEKVVDHLPMQTMDDSNDGGGNSAIIQNYRAADQFDSITTYHGSLRVGTTRESVAG